MTLPYSSSYAFPSTDLATKQRHTKTPANANNDKKSVN